ncbi:MAG: L,D-transpeptidase family protein [Oleiphilaceae bacterium]|nr:L,D-transpeptidase family protein [Oleiphilaceae bacterium]
MLVLISLWAAFGAQAQEAARVGNSPQAKSSPADPEAVQEPRVISWPVHSDVVGKTKTMTTTYEDTFAEIGNRQSRGYLEMVKANPGVDPWLPGEGTRITLPGQYILPDAKREGIVINLAEYRMYYYSRGTVQVYPVGVGTQDNPSPLTDAKVTMRLESPAWYPPKSVRAEWEANDEYLPRMIPPGPENPLGSFALMLSEKGYLIHGTNKQFGIGMAVSHGCFRMYNEDIERFVYMVDKGTSVQVVNQPVKIGLKGREVWLEVHRVDEKLSDEERDRLWGEVIQVISEFEEKVPDIEFQRGAVEQAVTQANGLPQIIGERLTQIAREPRLDTPRTSAGADDQSVQWLF